MGIVDKYSLNVARAAGDFYKLEGIPVITSKHRVLHHFLEEIIPSYDSFGILSAILS